MVPEQNHLLATVEKLESDYKNHLIKEIDLLDSSPECSEQPSS